MANTSASALPAWARASSMLDLLNVMLWREFKVNILSLQRLVQNYLTPLMIVLMFAFVFASNVRGIKLAGTEFGYLEFFLPGLFVMQSFQVFMLTFSIVRVDVGTRLVPLIVTAGAPVGVYVTGKLVASILLVLVQCVLITSVGYLGADLHFGLSALPLTAAVVTIICSAALWFCVGFLCGIYIQGEGTRDVIFGIVGLPLIFCSSIYYNIEFAPAWVQVIAAVNPLNYACRIVRGSLLGASNVYGWADILVLCGCLLVAAALVAVSAKRLGVAGRA